VAGSLVQEFGREPTLEEIGATMNLPPAIVENTMRLAQSQASLDAPVGEGDSDLHEFIPDEREHPGDAVCSDALRESLLAALETLPERERQVLRMRFGFNDGECSTLREVSQALHVTIQRARQLEIKALNRLYIASVRDELDQYLAG
jgi:RNA polymerase primary sigma factor